MIRSQIRTVTPEDARELLKHNTDNRALRQSWVDQLAGMIKDGKWASTHQGIAIADSRRILDGQHRLHAIVQAGVPVEIMVTTGLSEDVYRWIDAGKSRTAADRIHLLNDPHYNRIACSLCSTFNRSALSTQAPTVDDIEKVFLEMTDSVTYVASCWARRVRAVCLMSVGAALVGYHHKRPDQAVEACEMLLTGQRMEEGHPILALREACIAGRLSHTDHAGYWKATAAFHAHNEGRTLAQLVAATKDFVGNTYSRLARERAQRGVKGQLSRKQRGGQS